MNILILRLSSMGDCILTAPVFSYLKAAYPDSSLTFVTGSEYAQLFRDDPRLSAVIEISARDRVLPPSVVSTEWDTVVDLQNSGRSRRLLKPVRGRSVSGIFDKKHLWRFLLLVLRTDLYNPALHVAARYVAAAGGNPTGGDIPSVELYLNGEGCARAREAIVSKLGRGKRPILALLPFSAWKNKEWLDTRYEEVGRHFLSSGWNVAVIGGLHDTQRAEELRRRLGDGCAVFSGDISLYECGCLLKNIDLALGNDTGLSHLARACGVKTGIVYGPTTRQFGFFPYGKPSFRVFEVRLLCRPCHAHGGDMCFRFGRRICLERTETEAVIAGLEELLKDK